MVSLSQTGLTGHSIQKPTNRSVKIRLFQKKRIMPPVTVYFHERHMPSCLGDGPNQCPGTGCRKQPVRTERHNTETGCHTSERLRKTASMLAAQIEKSMALEILRYE